MNEPVDPIKKHPTFYLQLDPMSISSSFLAGCAIWLFLILNCQTAGSYLHLNTLYLVKKKLALFFCLNLLLKVIDSILPPELNCITFG